MSKFYMSKREKMERHEALKVFGEDGSFKTGWKTDGRATGNKPDGTFKRCPMCNTVSYIPHQDLPGKCSRPSCLYQFQEVRRGRRG